MRYLPLLFLLFLSPAYSQGVGNLPIVCKSPNAMPNELVSSGVCANQEFYDYPGPATLVRWCNLVSGQCAWDQLRYQLWSVLSDSALVDTCVAPPQVPGTNINDGTCLDWDQLPKSSTPKQDYFFAVPLSGTAPLTTLLQWNISNVSNCVASGGWNGNKGAQGSQTITIGMTTKFTLQCSGGSTTTGSVVLSWDAPTQNEDGSPLTNLAGFNIAYGTDPQVLSQIVSIPDPSKNSYLLGNLSAPKLWFFTVRAYNSLNVESANSNVTSKTVQPSQGKVWTGDVTVQVSGGTPVPKPPTNLIVEQATALLYEDGHVDVKLTARTP